MNKKKLSWIYVSLAGLLLFIAFFFISTAYQNKIHLSLPIYFFLLVVCDLAATAFLTEALTSSAEYSGNIFKGNLKLTGASVIFIIILLIGYRYRPQDKDAPFDLTIILTGLKKLKPTSEAIVKIELDNNPRQVMIDRDNKAVFTNIDSRYLGKTIPVSSSIEGYKITNLTDTLIEIPNEPLPVIRLPAIPVYDSSAFSGYVFIRSPNKPFNPVFNAVLNFTDFDKQITTDSTGHFKLFLLAKEGDNSSITVFKNNKWIFSDRITLSKNMQILIGE